MFFLCNISAHIQCRSENQREVAFQIMYRLQIWLIVMPVQTSLINQNMRNWWILRVGKHFSKQMSSQHHAQSSCCSFTHTASRNSLKLQLFSDGGRWNKQILHLPRCLFFPSLSPSLVMTFPAAAAALMPVICACHSISPHTFPQSLSRADRLLRASELQHMAHRNHYKHSVLMPAFHEVPIRCQCKSSRVHKRNACLLYNCLPKDKDSNCKFLSHNAEFFPRNSEFISYEKS